MYLWSVRRVFIYVAIFLLASASLNISFAKTLLQSEGDKPPNNAKQSEQDIRLLEVSRPIERELKDDEIHAYRLNLTAGQFLKAIVDQRGIDVIVKLFGPDGKQVIKVDSPNGTHGPEPVWMIVETTGSYRLEVHSLEKGAKPGRYEARVEELRIASQQDRSRVAGERAFMEAEILRAKKDAAALRKAIAKYEESLHMRRELGDKKGEGDTLSKIGGIYDDLGEKQKAVEYLNEALPVFRALGDHSGEAATLYSIGEIYKSLGEKRKTLEYYGGALPILRDSGDRANEAALLTKIGGIYYDLGEKQKALDYLNQGLPTLREVNNRLGEAVTLTNIGLVYNSLGEKQKALEYLNQALSVFQALGNQAGETAVLNNIGAIYNSLGEYQKALECANQALPLMQALGDQAGEVSMLTNIGLVYDNLGERLKALEYYNQALPLVRKLGNRSSEAETLNSIGKIYFSLSEYQKALDYFNQALPILRAVNNHSVEAATLNNIGQAYKSLGKYQKALDYINQALQIVRAAGDRSGEAKALVNIGAFYVSLREYQKALDYFNQALPILRAIGERDFEATALNNMGAVYADIGRRLKALEYYNQSLPILRALGDRSREAATLSNIGGIYFLLGEKQKALDYFNQALPTAQKVQDRTGEATTLNNIGAVYLSLGEKQKALDYFNQSLPILREVGYHSVEVTTISNIGAVHESLGDKQKALDFYRQAIAKIESLRASATIEEIKTGLSEQSVPIYQRAITLLMQLGRHTQAFDLTERARARTFLDQVGNVHPLQRNTANPQLLQEERTLASELVSLEQSLRQERGKPTTALNTDVLSSIENQLAVKQRRYEDLLIRLKLANPEYASLRSITTFTLSEAQKLLNNDTTLLSYFVTPEKTLAFIITRDRFRAIEIPVEEEELINSITWLRRFASLHNPLPESLKQLYGWLIAPMNQYIKTRTVGIIPHGILHYLPFAALTDGQHYFGEEHTLFYLPSASVLSFIRKKSKPIGNQVIAVAQSQAEGLALLQYADEEAEAVANLYKTEALTTGNAPKSEFLKRAGDYSIIHIAAHAELNTSSPLFSRIMLGADKDDTGALEVREVYDLDLSEASLVVLSACETQLGAHSQGDDIVGLNRAFIYAGTPTVIASLWTVDDESTSYLMKAFYTHLKGGMSKAESLRAAQADTRKKYPHPYHWAGFVLTGDPGPTTSAKAGQN